MGESENNVERVLTMPRWALYALAALLLWTTAGFNYVAARWIVEGSRLAVISFFIFFVAASAFTLFAAFKFTFELAQSSPDHPLFMFFAVAEILLAGALLGLLSVVFLTQHGWLVLPLIK